MVEEKPQEYAEKALAQAMTEEQRLVRCKTGPKGSILPYGEPQMEAKAADLVAGLNAVCIRFSNGRLSAIGTLSQTASYRSA